MFQLNVQHTPKEIQDGNVQRAGGRGEQVRLQAGWEGQVRQGQTMQAMQAKLRSLNFTLLAMGSQ